MYFYDCLNEIKHFLAYNFQEFREKMKYKKTIILLALVVFLLSIAGVSASEIDNTIASENANTIELSTDNDIKDNLQTSEENEALASTDYDEAIAQTDTEVLGADSATYSNLANEINQPGNITLTHKNYTYDKDATAITISEANKVIDGNGAIIDMNGSTIRAFTVTASGVTIKNLTIKNANYNGNGGAIYFTSSATSGTVTNCNFTGNTATYSGGAVYFWNQGTVSNCNFTNNTATYYGGAVYFWNQGTVTNCNFTGNTASRDGGAVYFDETGTVSNCNFTNNTAKMGNAIYINNKCTISDCDFTNNPITKGAIHSVTGDITLSNNIINVDDVVSDKNFTEIQKLIDRANDGDEITINGLYAGFGIPIRITKSLTLNGQNNTTLDAKKLSKILYITANNVIIKNIQFTSGYAEYGGAVYFNSNGEVTNCNFTGNTATYGGAVYFDETGTVSNCNFTGNTAGNWGGAVYFYGEGTVSNCNFTNNTASGDGGAINMGSGTVTNCNFVDNTARYGSAVHFLRTGEVTNCNFTGNTANDDGGAVYFDETGTVSNCNFTNNTASLGGAVYFDETGTVSNCNFTDNEAYYGGAVYFVNQGTVTNCNFVDNSANRGGAIFSNQQYTAADTCIFKRNSEDNVNTVIYPPTLNVNNFTTVYGSGEKLTFDLKTNSSIPVTNGNISISVYFKDNGDWVRNYTCLSGEGWIPDLPVGSYIAFFYTEYAKFQEINRTVTITMPNVRYSINVSSVTTNNKTVNITAKSDIPKDILWDGKLLFILPNGDEINATYGANGTWWAVHEFDKYDVYQVNATYVGLDNVTINNGTITINKVNSTISLDNIVLDYGESENVTVTTTGATGITAKIGESEANVTGFVISIPALDAGTYTLTVTTIPDDDYNPVTKEVNITVNKVNSTLTVGDMVFDYGSSGSIIVSVTGADGVNANVVGKTEAVVKVNGTNITVSGLDAGTYALTVTAIGDKNHNNVTKNATITVNKVNATLTVDDVVLDYGETKNITVTAEGATGIVARIGESAVNVTGFVISIPALDAGTYALTVTAIGDKNHNNITKNATITVNKLKTELTGNAITTTYNINKDLVITLKDSTGKALSGVKVTVDLNGAKTYTTDKNGQVKVSTKGLAPKAYTAKVTFNGNTNYDKSTKDIKVTVKKATPKLTAKKKTFKTTPKTKKYTIVLKDNTGKAIKKAKVTLKVKGKTYKATTNSKGKATFKITKLNKKGTFKATVTYKGNKYYNKVSKKAKIKVIVTFKTVSKGSKDKATVKEIQRALKDKGYYLTYQGHYLKVDGKFKGCTERSLKEFQKDNGLKVTGKVDEKTAKKLGIL